MPRLAKEVHQFELNYICSCLLLCKIRTSRDLERKFDYLLSQITKKGIFDDSYTIKERIAILKKALRLYNYVNEFAISMSDGLIATFDTRLKTVDKSVPALPIPTDDDLSNVTKSYDRLIKAYDTEEKINNLIQAAIMDKDFIEVPCVILGAGDTGTTLWLEKFKTHHGKTVAQLNDKTLPPVLMIAETAGSWHHDYTLAQRHSILERVGAENPATYLSSKHHEENPHANGRHVYQANQVNLGSTEAPLLKATVLKIEKKSNHEEDWQVTGCPYRLIVRTASGIKPVYTTEINVCTGLGPAKNILSDTILDKDQFIRLNQFDKQKQFTPIVDGNDFILTDKEEKSAGRKIVIYGGGGTAAACYRKGFFGDDIRTQDQKFIKENQKNQVIWIARNFEKAGTGKLATSALSNAKMRQELFYGDLQSIQETKDNRLILIFKKTGGHKQDLPEIFEIDCDQFIYSVGQDDSYMRCVCEEIETDLTLITDEEGMVLNVSSKDKQVIFFGAAAMAVREKEYMEATWKWLQSENIGGDVGPGSMPPSRAQIKRYTFLQGHKPISINANMDSKHLIIKFLEEEKSIRHTVIQDFVADILQARKENAPSGASRTTIYELLVKHGLENIIEINGLGHLVKKVVPAPAHPPSSTLLSWLGPQRETSDAIPIISSVSVEKKPTQPFKSGEEILQSSLLV
ncbi:hypothetical protein B6N58_12340 [Legionella micdadei]|uniref:hypothetical protein n=1 Tax=Legionella micdadei TaxID=451 RepID=UPI0009EF75CE|nr:hypothetical protein [Legionella micdadei]ARG98387.1 hypothetical protein B6N58_12340 [Legionella micdadei]NSL18708.1 hypothetical protein [Legionella micdadei]